MDSVVLIAYSDRSDAVEMMHDVAAQLTQRGVVATISILDVDPLPLVTAETLIVSFGGDGTFLSGAALAHTVGARILGVELGRVGFLPTVPVGAVVEDVMSALSSSSCSDRLAIELEMPSGEKVFAFNEIVVERLRNGQLVRVATAVDGDEYLTYSADGVLVSTPTGSSGYNFSAGGPVIDNDIQVLILTPIAPHFTIDRSVVLPDSVVVTLRAVDKPAAVIADGQERGVLDVGQSVTVRRHPRPVRVVVGSGFSLVSRLRRGLRDGHA